MKFAHQYEEALAKEDFPSEWVESAISYRQLKKCIKKVQKELASIGLDAHTLGQLLDAVEDERSQADGRGGAAGADVSYCFAGNFQLPRPRLLFVVRTNNGVPVDARLSPETKTYLADLAASKRRGSHESEPLVKQVIRQDHDERFSTGSEDCKVLGDSGDGSELPGMEQIEIPLTSDSQFFGLLQSEVIALDGLQDREQAQVSDEVTALGKVISAVAAPAKGFTRTDLYRWRQIFDLYLQANVFFSTNEQDGKTRTSSQAAKQLQWFSNEAVRQGLDKGFKRRESYGALQRFMLFNAVLLRNLKFQEINQTAMSKILKKFDKRTALGVKTKFPELMAGDAFLAQTMAKAISFKVSEEIVSLVPQLNDYLCPICFNISYKPVRLTCGHIFCIRCMITMQRARAKHCPLCRGNVVLDADSANLDPALMNFLRTYFPREVKAKQKLNERAAAVDLWGEDYAKCMVM